MKSTTIFDLAILLVVSTFIVISLGYQYEAKLFPLLLGLPTAALLVIIVIRDIVRRPEPKDNFPGAEIVGKADLHSYLVALVWIAVLLFKIYLVGFLIGIPLFTFLYLKVHNQSWLLSLILPLVMVAVIYFGFALCLKVQLYEGFLFM